MSCITNNNEPRQTRQQQQRERENTTGLKSKRLALNVR